MKEQFFNDLHRKTWEELETLLLSNKNQLYGSLPELYRKTCRHLAIAKERQYSYLLIQRLNELIARAHNRIYGNNSSFESKVIHFLKFDFPVSIYLNRWFFLSAFLLFFLPLLISFLGCYFNDALIYSFMSEEQVHSFERMYDVSAKYLGRERDSATDLSMFGFYIWNNIGIGFRTFASGLFFGLGTIGFLVFNGCSIGSIAGYMAYAGYQDTFFPFIIGHGSFELTAIVLSGAAGLRLGYSILAPGQYSRRDSIKLAARNAIVIMYGVFLFLLIAAFIEAFWSSSTLISNEVKYISGACSWVLVISYLLNACRPPN